MSIILAIETSVPEASIALSENGKLIASQNFESHRQQNKLLFPALQEILPQLTQLNKKPDFILVGTGPGSYSGSRISIAAAQGLGVAYQCPVIGIGSFLGTQTVIDSGKAYAIGDARRGSFFIAEIDSTVAEFKSELMDEDTFTEKVKALDAPLISFEPELPIKNFKQERPHAHLLIEAWQKLPESEQQKLIATPPQPQYLRAPFITKAKPGHPLLRNKK